MADRLNFILGSGERLMEPIPAPGRFMPERPVPYAAGYARDRLLQPLDDVLSLLAETPAGATVDGDAVVTVTLHPQYLAKTSYPGALLEAAGLRNLGSRRTVVEPERWATKEPRGAAPTTQLFAAVRPDALARWRETIAELPETAGGLQQLTRVEDVAVPSAASRLRLTRDDLEAAAAVPVEIVLHEGDRPRVLAAFREWARTVGVEVDVERRVVVGDLAFLPARAAVADLPELARFAFTRVVRSMPRLRGIRPTVVTRSGPSPRLALPQEGPLDPDLRVAVFDGGLLPGGPLAAWASSFDAPGVGPAYEDGLIHGHRVTSALLFGPLVRGGEAPRPYAHVDHYRVLDDRSDEHPEDLFDVLPRILGVLSTRPYEFVSLSVGPDLPMEDDDPHAWTVALDDHLSTGTTLLAVAVGNGGERDRASGNARIQPPGDCVNALAVGAADAAAGSWDRATYSSVGPGRSPGLVKPDVLGYGGCPDRPFEVLDHEGPGRMVGTFGTSFATPAAMRLAVGARALLGSRLSVLGARALLIHTAEPRADGRDDVGWGRLPETLEDSWSAARVRCGCSTRARSTRRAMSGCRCRCPYSSFGAWSPSPRRSCTPLRLTSRTATRTPRPGWRRSSGRTPGGPQAKTVWRPPRAGPSSSCASSRGRQSCGGTRTSGRRSCTGRTGCGAPPCRPPCSICTTTRGRPAMAAGPFHGCPTRPSCLWTRLGSPISTTRCFVRTRGSCRP